MIPLWTRAMLPPAQDATCGCALTSVGGPWVAHRLCPMPAAPVGLDSSKAAANSTSLPARLITVLRSARNRATPAESYPRYSIRLRPSTSTGNTLLPLTHPTIPHTRVLPRLSCTPKRSGGSCEEGRHAATQAPNLPCRPPGKARKMPVFPSLLTSGGRMTLFTAAPRVSTWRFKGECVDPGARPGDSSHLSGWPRSPGGYPQGGAGGCEGVQPPVAFLLGVERDTGGDPREGRAGQHSASRRPCRAGRRRAHRRRRWVPWSRTRRPRPARSSAVRRVCWVWKMSANSRQRNGPPVPWRAGPAGLSGRGASHPCRRPRGGGSLERDVEAVGESSPHIRHSPRPGGRAPRSGSRTGGCGPQSTLGMIVAVAARQYRAGAVKLRAKHVLGGQLVAVSDVVGEPAVQDILLLSQHLPGLTPGPVKLPSGRWVDPPELVDSSRHRTAPQAVSYTHL